MVDSKLVEYIFSELKLGINEYKIREKLLDAGWSQDDIHTALLEARNRVLETNARPGGITIQKKLIYGAVMLCACSAFALAYFEFKKADFSPKNTQDTNTVVTENADMKSKKILSLDSNIDRSLPIQLLSMSNDGKHVAYTAFVDDGKVVVVDGKVSNVYNMATDLAVGKEGKEIAFIGWRYKKQFVVRGVTEGRPYESILSGPILSNDEKNIAYVARKIKVTASSTQRNNVLVVNDEEVYSHDATQLRRTPSFSPDGTKIALAVTKNKNEFVLIYDLASKTVHEGKVYEEILGDPIFSNDGKIAYRVIDKGQQFIVIDGREDAKFSIVSGVAWEPAFSPDGKHTAYALPDSEADTYSVVLDGKRLRVHEIPWGSTAPKFNNDSTEISYEAGKTLYTYDIQSQQYVREEQVVDKLEQHMKKYGELMEKYGEPIQEFDGPNGNKYTTYAFLDMESLSEEQRKAINEVSFYMMAKHRVVLSDDAQVVADQIINPRFSSDGKYLTLGALRGNDIWFEVYSYTNGKLEKMPEEDGYILETTITEQIIYPTDEDGEIKGTPIEKEFEIEVLKNINGIGFNLDFTGKEGSQGLFSVMLNDQVLTTIYEGDVSEDVQSYKIPIKTIAPGTYKLKIRLEPLNKKVRSGVNFNSLVPGFVE